MEDEGRMPHPRETMDDVTEVADPKATARVNTVTINKNLEIPPATFLWLACGVGVGIAIACLLMALRIPLPVSAVVGAAVMALIPFMALTTTRDATQQKRWKRAQKMLKSKNLDGGVFFPNSSGPENITKLEEVVMKR